MNAQTREKLELAGTKIVTFLGGRWAEGRGMCLCPVHPDKTPSLSVRVGQRSLLVKCFAGCEAVAILKAIRDMRLDVPRMDRPDPIMCPTTTGAPMLRRAEQIWEEAGAICGGLAGRYLDDRHLEARPDALRYHARTPLGRGTHATFHPAIIAAVREGAKLVAIQRLFLNPDGSGLAMDIGKAKLTLARPLKGAVQLSPANTVLGLAEGVETALSASLLLHIPVWATLGAERLHQILLPPRVRHVVLLPDNDLSGRRAVTRAMSAYAAKDRSLALLWPWKGRNDWSDVLMHGDLCGGEDGVNGVRDAA